MSDRGEVAGAGDREMEAVAVEGSGGDAARAGGTGGVDVSGRAVDAVVGVVQLAVGVIGMAVGIWVLVSLPDGWSKARMVAVLVVVFLVLGVVSAQVVAGARRVWVVLWLRQGG